MTGKGETTATSIVLNNTRLVGTGEMKNHLEKFHYMVERFCFITEERTK